jgi:hypothetical protein
MRERRLLVSDREGPLPLPLHTADVVEMVVRDEDRVEAGQLDAECPHVAL